MYPASSSAPGIFVAAGSNIRPDTNVPEALDRLRAMVRIVGISTFYRTAAIERPEQPDFLNGVIRIETALPPHTLKFDVLRRVESALGRVRSDDRYAARTIDLDIVMYEDWVVDETDLQIPDPDLWTRPFLAVPLMELTPDATLPNTGEALRDIVAAMDMGGMQAEEEFTQCLRARLEP